MLIYSKIKGIKANVAESKDDEQDGKKKIFSLYYINTEKVYEMAMNGEPLEICHRESPFGVVFLGIHMPSTE